MYFSYICWMKLPHSWPFDAQNRPDGNKENACTCVLPPTLDPRCCTVLLSVLRFMFSGAGGPWRAWCGDRGDRPMRTAS